MGTVFFASNTQHLITLRFLSIFKSHPSCLSAFLLRYIISKTSTNICHHPTVIYRVAILGRAINLAAYKLCPRWFSNKRHSRTTQLTTIKRNVSPHSRGQCTLFDHLAKPRRLWLCLAIHLGVHTRRTCFDL